MRPLLNINYNSGVADRSLNISDEEAYSYAHECPTLSPEHTAAYDSDSELGAVGQYAEGSDDIGEDAAEVLEEILPFIEMAAAAYKSTSMKEDFQMVERSQLIHNVIDTSHLFGGVMGRTDTEVHVSILDDESVVMAFRGTEPTEWSTGFADVLTDLAEGQEPVKLYDGASHKPVYTSPASIRAHRGFQLALKDVTDSSIPSQNLRLVLQNLGMQAHDVRSVVCVGHSLGGALATLCAKWCREVAFPGATIGCVTIGSPRVGNAAFALDFKSRVVMDTGLSYRVVNKRDVVPCVPNLLTYPIFASAYKHVAQPIYLYEDTLGQMSSRLGGCRPSKLNLGFSDHKTASYIASTNAVLQAAGLCTHEEITAAIL
ncbi:hypothetical protein GOP47_0019173 [Adiantum capillus-veneris]|uniref:Fungal lipase-type domain-containing protein n=1 Tax=Adiantum capillus-veneris TaxID=13818 RepID=A0A9D4Z9E4_ADICA|nr:hypothetical protein GOP47_0019173 [Adiantum capillus-veneris]